MAAVVALSVACGRADVAQPTFVPDSPRAGETSAWYPFSEGEAGMEWTSPEPEQTGNAGRKYSQLPFVNNVVDAADTMPVWAAIAGTGRVRVSDDVPGAYVFASRSAAVPLCDLRASLEAQGKGSRPAESPNLANWAFLHGLAGDLHRADSYTVEFFAKFETEAGLFLFYDQGQKEQNRVTLARDTSGRVRLSSYTKANVTVAYPGGKTSLRDGMWHHYALVYRADEAGSATGRLTLYCDYTLVSEELAVSKDLAYVADVFRLFEGNQKMRLSAFRATVACAARRFWYNVAHAGNTCLDPAALAGGLSRGADRGRARVSRQGRRDAHPSSRGHWRGADDDRLALRL